MEKGTGLVLAGGGGKGIYQVGVLKSLAEAGVLDDIKAVSGTSIGGVNAVLFSEGLVGNGLDFAISCSYNGPVKRNKSVRTIGSQG